MLHEGVKKYTIGEYKIDVDPYYHEQMVKTVYEINNNEAKSDKNFANILGPTELSSKMVWTQTEVFNSLLELILAYGKHYFKNHNLTISNCWALIYKPLHYSLQHDHKTTAGAFCFYLNDCDTPINFEGLSIKPKKDTLVILPPYVEHSVPPHQGIHDRLVLAGNYKF